MTGPLKIGLPVWITEFHPRGYRVDQDRTVLSRRLGVIIDGCYLNRDGSINNIWSWDYYDEVTCKLIEYERGCGWNNGFPYKIEPASYEYRVKTVLEVTVLEKVVPVVKRT